MAVSKGAETRQRIVDKAIEIASTLGIEGLTLGVLATELQLSKSGLFAHFKSREALQIAVLEDVADRFRRTVVEPAFRTPRGVGRVRTLFERWLEWEEAYFQPGGCVFMAAANDLDDQPGPVRDVLVQGQRDLVAAVAQTVRAAIEEQHFRPQVDPEQFAFEICSLVHGYHHYLRLLRDVRARDHVRGAFDRLIASARVPD